MIFDPTTDTKSLLVSQTNQYLVSTTILIKLYFCLP